MMIETGQGPAFSAHTTEYGPGICTNYAEDLTDQTHTLVVGLQQWAQDSANAGEPTVTPQEWVARVATINDACDALVGGPSVAASASILFGTDEGSPFAQCRAWLPENFIDLKCSGMPNPVTAQNYGQTSDLRCAGGTWPKSVFLTRCQNIRAKVATATALYEGVLGMDVLEAAQAFQATHQTYTTESLTTGTGAGAEGFAPTGGNGAATNGTGANGTGINWLMIGGAALVAVVLLGGKKK